MINAIRFYGRPAFVERIPIANKCYCGLNLQWNNSLAQHGYELVWVGRYWQCWPKEAPNLPLSVNAFYSRKDNSVALLPAFLHHEDIVSAWSRGLVLSAEALYGTLGYVLGHEVAHAIDNTGTHYDKDGREGDSMPAASEKAFREKQKCLDRWYSSKPVPATNGSVFVDGSQTLDENMADLDGLKFASKALDVRRKRLGMPAASKQKFFKSFAEFGCESVTPSQAEFLAASDTHSPAAVRVNEALRNNAEFAKAYGCEIGSRMNPAEKCHVWGG
ncbi:Peptidase M13 [Aphelenchoides avenae]|nr:Peptidase M13 [Aphelenchus avenae]